MPRNLDLVLAILPRIVAAVPILTPRLEVGEGMEAMGQLRVGISGQLQNLRQV